MLHAAFVRSEIAAGGDHEHRHHRREGGARRRRRVHVARLPRPVRRGVARHARRGAGGAAAARHQRRPLRRRHGRARHRREPLPRRGRVRADRGRATSPAGRRRLSPPPPPTPTTRARRLGPRVERDGGHAVHADLGRPRRGVRSARRTSSSAPSSRTATSACRWRPGGSSPRGRPDATRWRSSCATQSVHETRNFFARYLDIPEEASPSPRATSAADSARRCSCSARSARSSSRRSCSASR